MATVVTAFAFDGDTQQLSVLLPGVNLSRSPTAEVTSVAIRTVHKGSIGGPQLIDGPLVIYQAVDLTGTARWRQRMSEDPNVECEWSAWYNRQPPREDPNLYVAGRCMLRSGSISVRLKPGNIGIVPDPTLFALECSVDVPNVGTDDWVEREVSWRGDVGQEIEVVRIQGDLNAEVRVDIVE